MAYDATDFVVTETSAPVRDPRSITDPRERVAYLRDFLRDLPPIRFDMGESGDKEDAGTGTCGAPACIGGWTRAFFERRGAEYRGICSIGEDVLSLPSHIAYDLFYPGGEDNLLRDGKSAYRATPAQAAAVLDHYLATAYDAAGNPTGAGKIDWSVA